MDPARRRLTVGAIEKKDTVIPSLSTEDAKRLLKQLEAQDLLGPVSSTGGKRGSVASVTDAKLRMHASFGEKQQVREGDDIDPTLLKQLQIGATCKKGRKPESPNQDSWSLLHSENACDLYCVYDGHGPEGHSVSNFTREMIPKLFMRSEHREADPAKALRETFRTTQQLIETCNQMRSFDASMSGSTCTVVYRPRRGEFKGKAFVAHVGDSRAVLMKRLPDGGLAGQDLTLDHKPNLPNELKRIEAGGGRVVFDGFFNYRVFAQGAMYPGLNMSRALGDCVAHESAGLSAEPDVDCIDISGSDVVGLIVATDGLWEFVESDVAVEMAGHFSQGESQVAAERLATEAWERWMKDSDNEISDDITVIVVRFD